MHLTLGRVHCIGLLQCNMYGLYVELNYVMSSYHLIHQRHMVTVCILKCHTLHGNAGTCELGSKVISQLHDTEVIVTLCQ